MTFHGPDKLKWMLKAVSVLAVGSIQSSLTLRI